MNNGDINSRHDGEEPRVPRKLAAAFKDLPPRRVFVPPAIDDAVLGAARRRLARPGRPGFAWLRSWLAWPAMAAACLIVIGVIYFRSHRDISAGFARGDVNRDGQVDILDAFQLARELQAGQKPEEGLDLNGDGVVDRRDAEHIAAQAVKLEKGGRS